MKTDPTAGLDLARLRPLLAAIDRRRDLGDRIGAASGLLLGRPYLSHPLVGSAVVPEVFAVSLEGFDCVTYVETVLGLASARTVGGVAEITRRLRYRDGRVEWRRRNHYMTGWIASNRRAGLLRSVRLPAPSVARVRRLSVVAGLAPERVELRCVPKRGFWRGRHGVRTGDLLFFASTRRNLDVFHMGIAVWNGGELRLRHAARSKGRVVEQRLDEFLKANAMAGVIVARPRDAGRARGIRA